MQIVRAFPERPPPGRCYVVDGWPRVPVDNYDYRGLLDLGDDVLVMDWDTAPSQEDVYALTARAQAEPDRIVVAPCLMYKRGDAVKWNVGSHRFRSPGNAICCAYVPGVPGQLLEASAFGFGMVYLPRAELLTFVRANPRAILKDTAFTHWRHHRGLRPAMVDWSVRPVHLHYPEAEDGVLTLLTAP